MISLRSRRNYLIYICTITLLVKYIVIPFIATVDILWNYKERIFNPTAKKAMTTVFMSQRTAQCSSTVKQWSASTCLSYEHPLAMHRGSLKHTNYGIGQS